MANLILSDAIDYIMVELSLSFNQEPKAEFFITDKAAEKILQLIKLERKENSGLRVKVIPGGCAGFSYDLEWMDLDKVKDEYVFEKNGAKVIVGRSDMRLITGSTLDYMESLMASKFELKNPNASTTCGCGKSFA